MRALLLAAGLGTRLDPLTRYVPKCLVPIRGRPLLDIWLEKLSRLGVDEFIVNTHHHAEMVEDHVRTSPFNDVVTLAYEPELLGTAGTLRQHAGFLRMGDNFVLHADNLCDDDLGGLLAAHKNRPADCMMTMLTFRAHEPSSCGIVETDDVGVMTALHHKILKPPSDLANAATYIFTPELVDVIVMNKTAIDFSAEILPKLAHRAMTYETDLAFTDIGTVHAFLAAQQRLV